MDLHHPHFIFILAAYGIAFLIYGFIIFRTFFQSNHLKRLLGDIKSSRHTQP